MKTVKVKIYSIDELSSEAQERAHVNWLQDFHFDDSEARETLKSFEEIFPVNVKNWEFGYHNFIDFVFTDDDEISELSGQRLATYFWNNYKDDIYRGKYYSTPGKWISGNYHYKARHSKIIIENDSCALTGVCYDLDILKPLIEFMDSPDHRDFKDIMYECLQAWIYSCRDEYEGRQTLESFLEDSRANGWEYLENGRLTCF